MHYSVETVECSKLIDSWTDLSVEEKNSIKDEFIVQDFPEMKLLCPNLTEFTLSSLVVRDDGVKQWN